MISVSWPHFADGVMDEKQEEQVAIEPTGRGAIQDLEMTIPHDRAPSTEKGRVKAVTERGSDRSGCLSGWRPGR